MGAVPASFVAHLRANGLSIVSERTPERGPRRRRHGLRATELRKSFRKHVARVSRGAGSWWLVISVSSTRFTSSLRTSFARVVVVADVVGRSSRP